MHERVITDNCTYEFVLKETKIEEEGLFKGMVVPPFSVLFRLNLSE